MAEPKKLIVINLLPHLYWQSILRVFGVPL